MALKLIVDNQTYIGYTIPGASPMRIAHESSKQFSDPFIADFIPCDDLLGKKPYCALGQHSASDWPRTARKTKARGACSMSQTQA